MKVLIIFITALFLFSCGSKNPTIRTTLKKKATDSYSVGMEQYNQGNLPSAKLFFQDALKNATAVDNIEDIIAISLVLTEVHLNLDENTEASNLVFSAKKLAEQEAIQKFNFEIALTTGKYYDKTHTEKDQRLELALNNYEAAMQYALKDEDKATLYNNIGLVYIQQNKLDEALSIIEKARVINENKQVFDALADNYSNLGNIHTKKGNANEALAAYLQALKHDKTAENSAGIIDDLIRIGKSYQKLSQPDNARNYFQRALKAAESINDKKTMAEIQGMLQQE